MQEVGKLADEFIAKRKQPPGSRLAGGSGSKGPTGGAKGGGKPPSQPQATAASASKVRRPLLPCGRVTLPTGFESLVGWVCDPCRCHRVGMTSGAVVARPPPRGSRGARARPLHRKPKHPHHHHPRPSRRHHHLRHLHLSRPRHRHHPSRPQVRVMSRLLNHPSRPAVKMR